MCNSQSHKPEVAESERGGKSLDLSFSPSFTYSDVLSPFSRRFFSVENFARKTETFRLSESISQEKIKASKYLFDSVCVGGGGEAKHLAIFFYLAAFAAA